MNWFTALFVRERTCENGHHTYTEWCPVKVTYEAPFTGRTFTTAEMGRTCGLCKNIELRSISHV